METEFEITDNVKKALCMFGDYYKTTKELSLLKDPKDINNFSTEDKIKMLINVISYLELISRLTKEEMYAVMYHSKEPMQTVHIYMEIENNDKDAYKSMPILLLIKLSIDISEAKLEQEARKESDRLTTISSLRLN